eukprot:92649-Alexandrium_andersonii.AAC.1
MRKLLGALRSFPELSGAFRSSPTQALRSSLELSGAFRSPSKDKVRLHSVLAHASRGASRRFSLRGLAAPPSHPRCPCFRGEEAAE